MGITIIRFLSLFFMGFALGGSLAHLFELPNKIHLPREDYLTVQQIYRGWALLGVPVAGALISTLVLVVMVRKERRVLLWTLIAVASIVGTQAIFWAFTYPANQQTHNWTVLPPNWEELRQRWEYSHAAGAVLNIIAHSALVLSILVRSGDRQAAYMR
jgi:ABC-type cobalamin transport system permease subunit